MAEIRNKPEEVILSREQLREVEGFQASFAALWNEMRDTVEEFDSIIMRHYFNRENGYLDEQQNNLREIVILQNRLEDIAARMGAGAASLKLFMKALQTSIQGGAPLSEAPDQIKQENKEPAQQKPAEKPPQSAAQKGPAAKANTERKSSLLMTGASQLCDLSQRGGEISIKLFFEEMGLLRPERYDLLREITRQLHELLYQRKLVGYSKTSLVFGRDQSLPDVLVSLEPVFLSESVRTLLASDGITPSGTALRLSCRQEGCELVYLIAPE